MWSGTRLMSEVAMILEISGAPGNSGPNCYSNYPSLQMNMNPSSESKSIWISYCLSKKLCLWMRKHNMAPCTLRFCISLRCLSCFCPNEMNPVGFWRKSWLVSFGRREARFIQLLKDRLRHQALIGIFSCCS